MNRTQERTPLEALSANVLDSRFESFNEITVEKAKNRIIDVLGCVIGGANAPGNVGLVNLVKDWGGKGEATLLVHGGKAPAHNVAMVNSIVARSYDFEVMGVVVESEWIASHNSATTVMTAITMGETKGITGKELMTALIAGDDVSARVLAAGGWDFGYGWDGTGNLSIFGATAIAGRLMGLNNLQLRNAFGIVLNQIAGSIQTIWDGTTTFKIHQGNAARNAIFSADLAKTGWMGVEDALLSQYGYYFLYNGGKCKNPEILTKDLGKKYYTEETFKSYPCGWPNHGPIECALAIVGKNKIQVADIEEVTVALPQRLLHNYYAQPFKIGDFPHANAIFSYQYSVATALLKGSVKLEHYSEDCIRDPEVNTLINRTKITELPGATGRATEVRVKMKNGEEFSQFIDKWKGDPLGKPLSRDEIITKFWEQVDFSKTITRKKAKELLKRIEKLEELDHVSEVVDLLVSKRN